MNRGYTFYERLLYCRIMLHIVSYREPCIMGADPWPWRPWGAWGRSAAVGMIGKTDGSVVALGADPDGGDGDLSAGVDPDRLLQLML